MNTQGTHKPFPINYMGFQCPCESWIRSSPKEKASQQSWSFGYWQGLSLGQATYWPTAWSCWVECILIWLPSKNASCSVERVPPHRHGTTTRPSEKAMWHCSWDLPGGSKFLMAREAEGKERAGVRHEYEGQYCHVFLKIWDDATMKMFLCLYSTPKDSLSPAHQVTEDKLN